jgi:hypothetical protein
MAFREASEPLAQSICRGRAGARNRCTSCLAPRRFSDAGLAPEDAHRTARRAIGGIEQTKQSHRDERSTLWLEQTGQDLRHVARTLTRNGASALLHSTLAFPGSSGFLYGLRFYDPLTFLGIPALSPPSQCSQSDSRNESSQDRSHSCLALRVAACPQARRFQYGFLRHFTRGKPHDHSGTQALSRSLSPGRFGYSTFAYPAPYSCKRDARTSLFRPYQSSSPPRILPLSQKARLD